MNLLLRLGWLLDVVAEATVSAPGTH